MDLDSFLATPRWEILQIISQNPSSPIEIAKETKTTVSYVSQQLKLLEAMGIVVKTKTGAVEKGKPRNIYSVSEDFVYFTVLTNGSSMKKKLLLNRHSKMLINILLIEDDFFHIPLEKFILNLGEGVLKFDFIFVNISKRDPFLILVSEEKGLKTFVGDIVRKIEEKVDFEIISFSQLKEVNLDHLHLIYDSKKILKKEKDFLKGGMK